MKYIFDIYANFGSVQPTHIHTCWLLLYTLTLFNCLHFSPTDISFGRYSGKSFLEFEGIEIGATLSVTMRFQTESMYGTLLYMTSAKKGVFFIKLYISNGTLQVKLHMHIHCMTSMSLPLQIMDQRIGWRINNPHYPHTPVRLFLQPKWGSSSDQYSTAGCWWKWACGAFEVREFVLQYPNILRS